MDYYAKALYLLRNKSDMLRDTIKEEIKRSGKTQKEISERTGITENQISKFLNGGEMVSKNIAKICEALDLELVKTFKHHKK